MQDGAGPANLRLAGYVKFGTAWCTSFGKIRRHVTDWYSLLAHFLQASCSMERESWYFHDSPGPGPPDARGCWREGLLEGWSRNHKKLDHLERIAPAPISLDYMSGDNHRQLDLATLAMIGGFILAKKSARCLRSPWARALLFRMVMALHISPISAADIHHAIHSLKRASSGRRGRLSSRGPIAVLAENPKKKKLQQKTKKKNKKKKKKKIST